MPKNDIKKKKNEVVRHFISIICLVVLLSAMSCAHKTFQTPAEKHRISTIEEAEGRIVTDAVIRKAEAREFVEIQFKVGSSLLTESAKSALQSLIREAKGDGRIDKIIVISWADEEYPSESLKKLLKLQNDLAEKRNSTIETYVRNMKNVEINTYNMAERPNAFSKLFNTTDSKLKSSLLAAGLPTTADSNQYAGKASHSVILVKVK